MLHCPHHAAQQPAGWAVGARDVHWSVVALYVCRTWVVGNLTARAYKRLPLAERSVPYAVGADAGAAFAVVHESVVVSYTSFTPCGGTAPPT
jgi:hypothetical protein